MHELSLIPTLAGSLAAALVCGYVTLRLGLSPIVGYLAAGILVGPHTPGFVADSEIAEQFADVGVILLMFGVGLQFHLEELLAVRKVAVWGALGQSAVATVLGVVIVRAFGGDWGAGIVFGLAISVASTVVLTRVLEDHDELQTQTGHIAVGWLVVEDLLTVFALVVLPEVFADRGRGVLSLLVGPMLALIKLVAVVGVMGVVGKRAIPWVLERVAATRSRELFTLTVLVTAVGIALGAAKLFGVSMALGAFLAGMVVGRSDYALRAATDALPMRDAFAVLFFVSIGILLEPRSLLETPWLIATTVAAVVVGKPAAGFVLMVLLGLPARTALRVAVSLGQIGEFSFILAAAGKRLGVMDRTLTNALIAASIASITLNPPLFRLARLGAGPKSEGRPEAGVRQTL